MLLEYQIPLGILDTQHHVKGMQNIGELRYVVVPSLPQRGPLYVFIFTTSNKVILFPDGVFERSPSGRG